MLCSVSRSGFCTLAFAHHILFGTAEQQQTETKAVPVPLHEAIVSAKDGTQKNATREKEPEIARNAQVADIAQRLAMRAYSDCWTCLEDRFKKEDGLKDDMKKLCKSKDEFRTLYRQKVWNTPHAQGAC